MDKYKRFRPLLNTAKTRSRRRDRDNPLLTITEEDLFHQWQTQNGRCPYTGIELHIPDSQSDFDKQRGPIKPSLDRIDPSKGYVPGNVQIVAMSANFAKHVFSHDEILQFFNLIRQTA